MKNKSGNGIKSSDLLLYRLVIKSLKRHWLRLVIKSLDLQWFKVVIKSLGLQWFKGGIRSLGLQWFKVVIKSLGLQWFKVVIGAFHIFYFAVLHFAVSLRFSLVFAASLMLLFSCEEEIEINLPPTQARLVVDGLITDEYTRHTVRLSLSDNYDQDNPHPSVSGANVQISDGQQIFSLTETALGIYRTDSLAGIIGKVYELEVNWEGNRYIARDSLLEVTEPESVPITVFENRFEFEYRRHLFGFPNANRWELNVIPDRSTPNLDTTRFGQQIGVKVFANGRREYTYFTHPSIEVNGLLNFDESHFYGFYNGATILVKKYSISDAHYQFLLGVFQETEWRGTLFDVIPANISTNVSGDALGFFAASAVKELRYRIE